MKSRPATWNDAPAIRTMAARFLSEDGPYFGRFKASEGAIERLLDRMLKPDQFALVLENGNSAPVGMFGAFVFNHPITGQIVASELCWWVEPEARGSRVAADMPALAIEWARKAGAEWFEMIAPNERIAKFYEVIGFERTDIHYVKVLR